MANIKVWLEDFEQENNEIIQHILVGKHYNDYDDDRRPESARGKLLSREEGLALLDVEFDSGYGGAECFPIYAWTQHLILFIQEYDGSTGLGFLPRNPTIAVSVGFV